VVDDGSTDDTEARIKEISFSNLSYTKISNRERGHARNLGYEMAKGSFVVFLDSDDLLLPRHLVALKEAIDSHPEINFFATKYEFILPNGKTKHSDMKYLRPGLYNYKSFLSGNFLACQICVRKGANDYFLFEEDRAYAIMEDWMFLLQNLTNNSIYIVDEVTVQMRDHIYRSMRINRQIVDKRLRATAWVETRIHLTDDDRSALWGFSFYFCSIHKYIEGETIIALQYLGKAIHLTGLNSRHILLALKILVWPRKKSNED
jgi:GalNAc5-diNAcBac-PP-undecaprenol beta-1,3-glucosyltransferase